MTLWLTDRLPFLWRFLGVNYSQMRAILSVKLALDNRRPVAGLNSWRQREGNESRSSFWTMLAIYALFGGIVSIYLVIVPREAILLPTVLFFGYTMAICAMTLISDFSSVVLDTTDNQILLFRPVDGRTILTARIVHIASYLLTIALAVSVVGLGILSIRFGSVVGLLVLLLILLSALLMVFLTNVFYLVLMRFMSEERLRETINYFQIVMAILFYGGFQFMPRLIDRADMMDATGFAWQWWHHLLPPFWAAGSVDMAVNGATTPGHWAGLGLILTVPFIGLWLMNRVLAPAFANRMATLDQAERTPKEPAPVAGNVPVSSTLSGRNAVPTLPDRPLVDRLAGWLTRGPLERAAFTMIWHLTGRDRKFKLKTYPSLGFGIAYAVIMGTKGSSSGLSNSRYFHLFILYFGGIYLLTAILQLMASDNYKAAWIYESAPVQRPGELLTGSLKALFVKLLLPYFALLAGYVFYRNGVSVLPDALLALSGSTVIMLVGAITGPRSLPFSIPQDAIRQNMTARSLIGMFVIGLVAVAHWGLTYVPYGVGAAIPVMLGIAWGLLRSYRQTSWSEITVA